MALAVVIIIDEYLIVFFFTSRSLFVSYAEFGEDKDLCQRLLGSRLADCESQSAATLTIIKQSEYFQTEMISVKSSLDA